MPQTMSGTYVHLRSGQLLAREMFSVREEAGRWSAHCVKNAGDTSPIGRLEIKAVLDLDWKVLGLEANCKDFAGPLFASYRWREGGWGGVVSRFGQTARDCHIPMAEGLEVYGPLAFFDDLLLRRLKLPVATQVRVELLDFDAQTLEMAQSYRIIERIADEAQTWRGQKIDVACYRITNPLGEIEHIWVHYAGACLCRKSAARQNSYSLLEFSSA